jgi:hypothetical protein
MMALVLQVVSPGGKCVSPINFLMGVGATLGGGSFLKYSRERKTNE